VLPDPARPKRTVFQVSLGTGEVIVETGPEARPFPELQQLDVVALGDDILRRLADP